jgi:hypothetical protein
MAKMKVKFITKGCWVPYGTVGELTGTVEVYFPALMRTVSVQACELKRVPRGKTKKKTK